MSLEDQSKAIRKVLRKKPQTAAEIAERAGYPSARSISRALGSVVATGEAVKAVEGRVSTYAKP